MHIVIYHSNTTDMWEVAGLLFLSSETKEKVESGFSFFHSSLVSSGLNTGEVAPLIFYLNKEFYYISVIEDFFPNSYVFLCFIHTRRYFKDKVFTGKAAKKPKKSLRERAEEAATFNLDDNPETCPLCFFRFNEPIKKDKIVTRCIKYQVLVHEMCLVKSGRDCEFN